MPLPFWRMMNLEGFQIALGEFPAELAEMVGLWNQETVGTIDTIAPKWPYLYADSHLFPWFFEDLKELKYLHMLFRVATVEDLV